MKLINESQRFQKLARVVNEEQDVEEGIGKAIGTAALGAALALGSPSAKAQTTTDTTKSININVDLKTGKELVKSFIKNPFTADTWSKMNRDNEKLFKKIKSILNREQNIPYEEVENLGKQYKNTETADSFLNRTSTSLNENKSIEQVVNEALRKFRKGK
jgi:hypothetical protein